jgi:uncharacterized protein YpuA (DUF1002 family)
MPRKKNATKKQAKATSGQTYYKAKNGRFYKKIQVDGKTRCRFVSNSEAMGKISAKKTAKKPSSKRVSKAKVAKPTGTSSPPQSSPNQSSPESLPPKPKRKPRRRKPKKESAPSVD